MIIFLDIETISNGKLNDKRLEYGDKASYLPELNEIVTICVWYKQDAIKIKNLDGSEKDQIKEFFAMIKWKTLCWFNIKKFDLPFIVKRALHYGLRIPDELKIYGKKPREVTNVIDLQEVYAYWVFGAVGNTDLVCSHLLIDNPKEAGVDWSMVQELYDDWQIDKIVEYCKSDVKSTIDMYDKFLELNML